MTCLRKEGDYPPSKEFRGENWIHHMNEGGGIISKALTSVVLSCCERYDALKKYSHKVGHWQ